VAQFHALICAEYQLAGKHVLAGLPQNRDSLGVRGSSPARILCGLFDWLCGDRTRL
jgi:hypothetical protein